MATRGTARQVAAASKPGTIATRAQIPVQFVESDVKLPPDMDVSLADEGFTEAPTSLAPTAEWTTPMETLVGQYLGMQPEVGPNNSRLYSVKIEDGTIVGLWGAEVLDSRIDLLFAQGMRPGDTLKVVYVGDGQAKPGRNAPRIFKCGYKAATRQ
jgi:hypothetical protein